MTVKFKGPHGPYFRGDVATFDEAKEAELVASGKAEAYDPPADAESDPPQDGGDNKPGDPPKEPEQSADKAVSDPPADKAAKPAAKK